MAEPVTSTAGAAVGAKYAISKFAVSAGLGAVVAAIIAMSLAYPKTKREFVAALTSTLAFSIFGGAAAIEYFGITAWGPIAQGISYLLCGLPAWLLVRWVFSQAEKNQDGTVAGLINLIKQVRSAFKSE